MKQLRKGPVSLGALKEYPSLPHEPGEAVWNTEPMAITQLQNCGHHPVALAVAAASMARVPRLIKPPANRTIERLARRERRKAQLPDDALELIIARASGILEKMAAKGLLRTRHKSRYLGPLPVFKRAGLDISRKQIRSVSKECIVSAGLWLVKSCGFSSERPPGDAPVVFRPALTKWVSSAAELGRYLPQQRLDIDGAALNVVNTVRSWSDEGVLSSSVQLSLGTEEEDDEAQIEAEPGIDEGYW